MCDDQIIGSATGRSVWATATPSPDSTRRRGPSPLGVDRTDGLDRPHVDGTGTRCARRKVNAFFAEHGLFSLVTAHGLVRQSS
jgi:hypothetical protein